MSDFLVQIMKLLRLLLLVLVTLVATHLYLSQVPIHWFVLDGGSTNREPSCPAMVMSAASHRCAFSMLALTVLFVFAALVSDVIGGRHHVCPPFSCGGFRNISYPFRRQGDPSGCGVKSYELVCTDANATNIQRA